MKLVKIILSIALFASICKAYAMLRTAARLRTAITTPLKHVQVHVRSFLNNARIQPLKSNFSARFKTNFKAKSPALLAALGLGLTANNLKNMDVYTQEPLTVRGMINKYAVKKEQIDAQRERQIVEKEFQFYTVADLRKKLEDKAFPRSMELTRTLKYVTAENEQLLNEYHTLVQKRKYIERALPEVRGWVQGSATILRDTIWDYPYPSEEDKDGLKQDIKKYSERFYILNAELARTKEKLDSREFMRKIDNIADRDVILDELYWLDYKENPKIKNRYLLTNWPRLVTMFWNKYYKLVE
jgi:cell division protein FtsB